MKTLRKSALSPAWRALVNRCQNLNFAVVDGVTFEAGEPVEAGTAVKTVAFGTMKDNGPAPAFGDPEAVLSDAWMGVITLAASRQHLRVRRFEVAHGNPLKLHIEESVELSRG